MSRLCLDCGEEISGRIDKKFCSDQCRNNFNNKQNSDSNNLVRNINNILRKNRRILSELNKAGKTKTHKEKLLNMGYNLNYHTHTYTTKTGTVYFFCYDFGYLPLEKDFFFLVKREEESPKLLQVQQ
jgi:predicted nucleic acid-binding Zn ribbon protein